MFEDLKTKIIIKTNRLKYRDYYNQLEKANKYLILNGKKDLKYLYLVPKLKGIIIKVQNTGIKNIKEIKSIVKEFPNKEIQIYEKENLLKDKEKISLYNISRKIFINTQYIETKNYNAKNEVFLCDINTYILIIEKIRFLTKICKKNFSQQDEQIMFIITQLLKYIKYVDYKDNRTCMANAILLGTGVCIDFAITLYKCLEVLGIECKLVRGISSGEESDKMSKVSIVKKSNHAWNQVKIGTKWYNVDITWMLTQNDLKWILIGDKEFEENCKHIAIDKEYCHENYDREKVKKLYEKYIQYDSVLKKFDEGNKEEKL